MSHSIPDEPNKTIVQELLTIGANTRLAPTYKVLLNVSLQFAYIVGVGPEDNVAERLLSHASYESYQDGRAVPSLLGYQNPISFSPILLEQCFPSANHVQTQTYDLWADLVNFGSVGSSEMPWDFFNIGQVNVNQVNLAEDLALPLKVFPSNTPGFT
jgi:hypothetical protein